ncbi:MAG: ABC transporter ATP-binding protein [Gammaproteobacteria bacterium]
MNGPARQIQAPAAGKSTDKDGAKPLSLEVIGLSKRFGSLQVLDKISLRLSRGEFHALLGGNGAGKSTLVKCIMGHYHADEGTVLVNNRECEIRNTRDAHRQGLGMVYQQFTLVPGMTVLENLVLSRPLVPGFINWRQEARRVEAFMLDTPFRVPLHKKVNELAAGEKQKVEILKQLVFEPEILILDEPTSVMTPQEADDILGMLKERTHSRDLTVLVITHKFREVMNFADTVSVLRQGELVHSGPLADKTPAMLAEWMIGKQNIAPIMARGPAAKGPQKLEIHDLRIRSDSGALAVDGLSLELCAGEILGIAGVSGNGQRELVEALSGQRRPEQGEIRVGDRPYSAHRSEMIKYRSHCLPEEPLANACVPRMNLAENLALRHFDRPDFTRWRWFIDPNAQHAHARGLIERYRITPADPNRPIATLSGGNVQRLVLARELSDEAELLIVANPCFGLDFAAAAEIRSQLMQSRNRGAAILLVSEDLDELLELSDRIAVMFEGRLRYETTRVEADIDILGLKMAGQ